MHLQSLGFLFLQPWWQVSRFQVSLPTQYNGLNQSPVGALSNALGRLQASRPLRELREAVKGVTKQLPEGIQEATSKIDEYARGMISGSGSTLFEELGLYYIGPIDGHNLDNLLAVLKGIPLFLRWSQLKQLFISFPLPLPLTTLFSHDDICLGFRGQEVYHPWCMTESLA